MAKKRARVVLLPSKRGERGPKTPEEAAQALLEYFRAIAKISPDPWWPLGASVATMWQDLLAQPRSLSDALRFLFVLNCSRSLGSAWLFMNSMANTWAHDEMLGTALVPSSRALWDGVEHALSERQAYCLDCQRFYDVTATMSAGEATPSPACPNCGRAHAINLTVRTPYACPKCFEARPADTRICQACRSEIEDIIARNRIEPWT